MWCCMCMGKFNQSDFFSKKTRFYNFAYFLKKLNKNADIPGMIHHKMMVFTIHMLRAQERFKHLAGSGWKNTFLRIYRGQNEARNARGRGVGALLLLLLLSCKNQGQWSLKKNRDGSRKYPRKALGAREGRYVPAKGAMYPQRALCTREGRYVPAKGAICTREGRYRYPRRALHTREGRYIGRRYVPAKGAIGTREGRYVPAKGAMYPQRALCTRKGAMYPRRAL